MGIEHTVYNRKIPYNSFLIRASKATSIPITVIHKAIIEYSVNHTVDDSYFNEDSLTRFIASFNDWKCVNLQ